MIDTLTGYVERNWARPYEVATSLLGLLLTLAGLNEPLGTASAWIAALGARTSSHALATADAWMNIHHANGEMTVALIGVAAAAGFAALTTSFLPTRSGGTFWVFAALGVYAGASLGRLLSAVVFGLAIRSVVEAARTTVSDAAERAGFCLFNIPLGAFWLPIVALL